MEEIKSGLQVGQKVKFNYWDHEEDKEVYGTGRITEIDEDGNGIVLIQTTRKLHWMEYDHQMKNIRII